MKKTIKGTNTGTKRKKQKERKRKDLKEARLKINERNGKKNKEREIDEVKKFERGKKKE